MQILLLIEIIDYASQSIEHIWEWICILYLHKIILAVKKVQPSKRKARGNSCEIKSGGQEMAVMVQ